MQKNNNKTKHTTITSFLKTDENFIGSFKTLAPQCKHTTLASFFRTNHGSHSFLKPYSICTIDDYSVANKKTQYTIENQKRTSCPLKRLQDLHSASNRQLRLQTKLKREETSNGGAPRETSKGGGPAQTQQPQAFCFGGLEWLQGPLMSRNISLTHDPPTAATQMIQTVNLLPSWHFVLLTVRFTPDAGV